jgi:DNA-binding NtrC family response regulator
MPKKSILVVDDEVSIRKALAKVLEREGHQVTAVKSAEEALAVAKEGAFNLVVADLILPDANGIELIKQLQAQSSSMTSVLITGNATVESAIEATKQGVFHYITKPFNLEEVVVLIGKALEHGELNRENRQLKTELKRNLKFGKFVGDSEAIVRVYRLIEKVADTDSTVLISGESGTGKEIVARSLHYYSNRAERLFVPVNCGAIPAGLLESELFGHVRGAFTGATANREGRFQAANGGTIFLDEVGEMPPDLQVKLLRVLQTKSFEPVGSVKPFESDARVIAATNLDLEKAVIDRRFREDLFYRLNVIPIHMPALRERRGDIPLLIHHFLEIFNQDKKCDVIIRSEEILQVLMDYDWPGNVRELENLVQRLVILKQVGEIELKDLPPKIFGSKPRMPMTGFFFSDYQLPGDGVNFKDLVSAFEDHLLAQALSRTSGNKNKASELLQMNRTTLVEKLKKRSVNF